MSYRYCAFKRAGSSACPSTKKSDDPSTNNVQVVSSVTEMAMSSLYQTAAHANGRMYQTGISTQKRKDTMTSSATSKGVKKMNAILKEASAPCL